MDNALFVLVGGWPGSGKSTLARALARQLNVPLVRALPGRLVEVRCTVPLDVARERYWARAEQRDGGHFDKLRSEQELWGQPSRPLGLGAVVEVDTSGPVDIQDLATVIARAASAEDTDDDPASCP